MALTIADGTAYARVAVHAGESLRFSFSYSEQAPAVLPPLDASLDDRIDHSVKAWQNWGRHAVRRRISGHGRTQRPGSQAAQLRSLGSDHRRRNYLPSGTSRGRFDWDYRYCWLRDASFTIRALLEWIIGMKPKTSLIGCCMQHADTAPG